jgi:hypothetical protein
MKKQTAVEWLIETHFGSIENCTPDFRNKIKQANEVEEKLQLELVNKFVFDYTYNYRGNKTLYEYIDVWYKEFKRLEEKHKNK